jgi:hypothetical protein
MIARTTFDDRHNNFWCHEHKKYVTKTHFVMANIKIVLDRSIYRVYPPIEDKKLKTKRDNESA